MGYTVNKGFANEYNVPDATSFDHVNGYFYFYDSRLKVVFVVAAATTETIVRVPTSDPA